MDELIWESARSTKKHLTKRTSTLPVNDITGLMHLVKDHRSFWLDVNGSARDTTWEVSNVGVLKVGNQSDATTWRVNRVVFNNPSMVAGAAIGVNVASATGGYLTITISWQEDVVPAELTVGLAQDLQLFATRFHEAGKFSA
jgi:hypothetical protein